MNMRDACAVILGGTFFLLFLAVMLPLPLALSPVPPAAAGVGAALWKGRTYEGLLQGMVILAGVLAILLLLGLKESGRVQR